jgi:hypothetical protein
MSIEGGDTAQNECDAFSLSMRSRLGEDRLDLLAYGLRIRVLPRRNLLNRAAIGQRLSDI